MQYVTGPGYAKRDVPRVGSDAKLWPSRLAAWLAAEFGNVQRGMARASSRLVTGDTTARTSDGLILGDTTAGAFTVTLPDPATVPDMVVTIKRISAGAHALTIGGTVDGALNPTLGSQYASKTMWAFAPAGSSANWYLVAQTT